MKTCCVLKGVVVVVLLYVQGNVLAQSDYLLANAAEQPVATISDSLQPQAAFNLLSFTGTGSSGQAILSWKTDSRSRFAGFILERSVDETAFSAIGEVAITSSNKTNSFTYADNKPAVGRNFYRLKMMDSSGKSTYSAVISLTHVPVNDLQVHYDAASGTIGITGMETGSQYQLKVYNCNGQIMLQKAMTIAAASISINTLPHGLYVVYATDGTAAPVSRKIIW